MKAVSLDELVEHLQPIAQRVRQQQLPCSAQEPDELVVEVLVCAIMSLGLEVPRSQRTSACSAMLTGLVFILEGLRAHVGVHEDPNPR